MKKHTAIEALESRIAPATVFAVNDSNTLFSFDSATPGTLSAGIPITGLSGGQLIKAMDFSPATGELFGIAISGAGTFTGQLYKINTTTGAATAPGAPFSTTLATATGYGMEFDPTTGFIRVVNTDENNLRLSPVGGDIVSVDVGITGVTSLSAIAHTNNYNGATSTTLYGVNYTTDDLMRIGGLNSTPDPIFGAATKVADTNVTTAISTQDRLGLDIHTTLEGSTAYYTGVVVGTQNLYTLNLATGAATLVGAIGGGSTPIFDIAVQPTAALAFPDGKSFTYTDGDGDLVTVKTTVGTLKSSQFSWLASTDGTRRELTAMTITDDTTFTGANLTISAKKTATGGDGRVEVGSIFATGVNLGAVKIGSNIGKIDVGTNDAVIPSVKSFEALSLGRAVSANDDTHISSSFIGPVPVFKVKNDINSTSVFIPGKVGTFSVGGSIIGGDRSGSGHIQLGGGANSVLIGGSLIGGEGENSGRLLLRDTGLLKIGGSIIGGDGLDSGQVSNFNSTKTVIIGGSIIGGTGKASGQLFSAQGDTVKIGGSVIGGDGESSGTATSGAKKSFTIGSSIVGGDGLYSGAASASAAATVKLVGSITAGKGSLTGYLYAGTNAKSVFVGGSIDASQALASGSGFLSFNRAKTVTIKGGLIGSPDAPASIFAYGASAPADTAESIAFGSLIIGGSVVHGQILIGAAPGFSNNVNSAAGKITIGGDFLASSIIAGFFAGTDGDFGTADDAPADMDTLPNIKAAIASIVIKGRASGTGSDGDHYGIQAEQLGSIAIAGRKVAIDPLAQDNQLVGPYADFRIRELAIP